MEGDKEAYVEETGKALKRQRKNINELNVEKSELTRKLRVTKSRHNRNKDAENAAKIARLAEEQDTLGILIKREKQNMKVKYVYFCQMRSNSNYFFRICKVKLIELKGKSLNKDALQMQGIILRVHLTVEDLELEGLEAPLQPLCERKRTWVKE